MVVGPSAKQQRMKDISFVLSYLGFLMISLGTVLLLIPALPWIYYRINVQATSDEVDSIGGFIGLSALGVTPTPIPTRPPQPTFKLPAFNPEHPKTNTLRIPSIGVNGAIHEGGDSKLALYKGIWRIPEFGTPVNNEYAIILAAHRFGYIEWSASFRKTDSFANLPSMQNGETFSIIWGQREYFYKVYKIEENTVLTDYDADVILYTCKYLKSPVRIVVYAKRIAIE